MPEHKLTLADLEAVEKASNSPQQFEYRLLSDRHAVEMKQALTEALSVIAEIKRSVGFYAEEEFPLPSHQGSCGTPIASCDATCMEIAAKTQHNTALLRIARFGDHWPGLMKGKEEQ